MKLVDIGQISKDNSSLVPESEGQASAFLWIHGIVVALGWVGEGVKINKQIHFDLSRSLIQC